MTMNITPASIFKSNIFTTLLTAIIVFTGIILISISPAFSDEDIPNYNSTTDHTHDNIYAGSLSYERIYQIIQSPYFIVIAVIFWIVVFGPIFIIRYS